MNLAVEKTTSTQLLDVAVCYQRSFPETLSTALGKAYVLRTFEWYLSSDSNFLFHAVDVDTGDVIGFCGGMANDGVHKRGSASEVIQFSFNVGLKSLLVRPWLVFHPEMRSKYRLVWKNVRKRLSRVRARELYLPGQVQPFVGLVVIGVDPNYQNKGISRLLLQEFESRAKTMGFNKLRLSVKAENKQAIRAYEKFGWSVNDNKGLSLSLTKEI